MYIIPNSCIHIQLHCCKCTFSTHSKQWTCWAKRYVYRVLGISSRELHQFAFSSSCMKALAFPQSHQLLKHAVLFKTFCHSQFVFLLLLMWTFFNMRIIFALFCMWTVNILCVYSFTYEQSLSLNMYFFFFSFLDYKRVISLQEIWKYRTKLHIVHYIVQ